MGKSSSLPASISNISTHLDRGLNKVEEDFDKAIDRAVAIGMNKEEILEVVKLILDEK